MKGSWVAAAFVVAVAAGSSCEGPMSGGACSPIGTTKTDSKGQLWTCVKNTETGNGFWYKGRG